MNLILVDTNRENFLPLTFTKPVAHLRIGIFKIFQKWEKELELNASFKTASYLSNKFKLKLSEDNTYVSGSLLPNEMLVQQIKGLNENSGLSYNGIVVAYRSKLDWDEIEFENLRPIESCDYLENWWDLFLKCGDVIKEEFFIKAGAARLSVSNTLIGSADLLYIHPNAKVEGAVLNTVDGPIFIEDGAEVMEGSCLRGPLVILNDTKIKMGAKVYGPTSIGPKCRVGGELKNSVIQGYSNKSHEGYLGNAAVGEWVNLGAGTECSNLKNTFSSVKTWSYTSGYVDSELRFLGPCIGDYSKTAIGTRLNTATVVGVNANVFGNEMPGKLVANFTWGNRALAYDLEKAIAVNKSICEMESEEFSEEDAEILTAIHQMT